MGTNLPDFNRAEYVDSSPTTIDAAGTFAPALESASGGAFLKSLVYGLGAAIVGSIVYAGFTIVTHIEIGYLAWGVGLLVGKAMMLASDNSGGRKYQIAAGALTYLAVAYAYSIEMIWQVSQEGKGVSSAMKIGAIVLGPVMPLLQLKDGVGGIIGAIILFAVFALHGASPQGRTVTRADLMQLARIILFTRQIDLMSHFYGHVLGLPVISEEKGWREFDAGAARIALHSGPASPGTKGPKIVFHAEDVSALRETLVARGARFGKVRQGEVFCLCDGKDPDGNPLQLSNR